MSSCSSTSRSAVRMSPLREESRKGKRRPWQAASASAVPRAARAPPSNARAPLATAAWAPHRPAGLGARRSPAELSPRDAAVPQSVVVVEEAVDDRLGVPGRGGRRREDRQAAGWVGRSTRAALAPVHLRAPAPPSPPATPTAPGLESLRSRPTHKKAAGAAQHAAKAQHGAAGTAWHSTAHLSWNSGASCRNSSPGWLSRMPASSGRRSSGTTAPAWSCAWGAATAGGQAGGRAGGRVGQRGWCCVAWGLGSGEVGVNARLGSREVCMCVCVSEGGWGGMTRAGGMGGVGCRADGSRTGGAADLAQDVKGAAQLRCATQVVGGGPLHERRRCHPLLALPRQLVEQRVGQGGGEVEDLGQGGGAHR